MLVQADTDRRIISLLCCMIIHSAGFLCRSRIRCTVILPQALVQSPRCYLVTWMTLHNGGDATTSVPSVVLPL